MKYLPWPNGSSFGNDINDSGVISISAGLPDQALLPCRYDPESDSAPVCQQVAGSTYHINSGGVLTGGGYFPDSLDMFRMGTGAVDILNAVPSFGMEAVGFGIDNDGTVVGQQLVTPTSWEAVRYTDAHGAQFLQDLLPPSSIHWDLLESALWIGGGDIVGMGLHDGLHRAYLVKTASNGEVATITDLGIPPEYATDAPNCVSATKENLSGEIVGGVYDTICAWPGDAFVYTAATGMISLNSLIDPHSGWILAIANGINDKHEVVGYGFYHDDQLRAFKLTLPDLNQDPCPPPSDSCHTRGHRDLLTGLCSNAPVADGAACDDGNACTQTDTCVAGVCTGGNPITCAGAGTDQCRSAGSCDPATGMCSTTLAPDGQDCDDGNCSTTGDKCRAGTCVPGGPTVCGPDSVHYAPLIDLGSSQGWSYATDINNNHVVIGSDVEMTQATGQWAAPGSRAFTWTESEGMTYLPSPDGEFNYGNDINDSRVISMSSAGFDNSQLIPCRYDQTVGSAPVCQQGAPGNAYGINSSGTLTGGGYYYPAADGGGYYELQMFRIGTDAVQILPPAFAPGVGTQAVGVGINDEGSVVGQQLAIPTAWEAVRYSDALQRTEFLNDLLPVNSQWDLQGAVWIGRGDAGGNDGDIVGSGVHTTASGQALNRAYLIKTNSDGTVAKITDLGLPPAYPTDAPECVFANKENSSGEIVGGVYDTICASPHDATVWTAATGMISLNSLIDPNSGWTLVLANGINDQHEVVGYGYYYDQPRAFKLTLPDLSPCPAPADSCHLQGQKNLLTGICSYPDVPDSSTCGGITVSLLGVAQEGTTWKAIFDYQSASPTDVTIPYGNDNGLRDATDNLIASPPQYPPTTFVHQTPHAPFVATISGSQLTWKVGTHSATAAPNPQQSLTVTTLSDGTNYVTVPGVGKVNLDSTPPADPGPVKPPQVGDPFNGVLNGQFAVSPSGAATYSVPISIPPGVAGMAPNLSLAYSSQAADGIAGQGWSLGGLSVITRCPRTRQQDGFGRPVMMDSLTDAQINQDHKTDGICLDGEKLFDTPAGTGDCTGSSSVVTCYTPERKDFSKITFNSTGEFQVVTKAGETRYYGLQPYDRVNDSGGNTAVWILDHVVDGWGNYFDFHYNNCSDNTCQPNFTGTGIWVSDIAYTGSLGGTQGSPIAPFNHIAFQYECRPDVRWTRFSSLTIPQNQRLKSITTPQGIYSLTYKQAAPQISPTACASETPSLGLSELGEIGYCAGTTCMQSMKFGWTGGLGGPWRPNAPYQLPPSIVGTHKGLRGTQFVDIDGDGRPDFVLARTNGIDGKGHPQTATLRNTGSGWSSPLTGTNTQFPVYLSDEYDNPTTARLADFDGDGKVDVIVDSANVMCDPDGSNCVSCPVDQSCPGSSTHYSPAVWLNRFTVGGGGGWEFHREYANIPSDDPNNTLQDRNSGIDFNPSHSNPATVADMDGDGRPDLVRVGQTIQGFVDVDILFNEGPNTPEPWISQHFDAYFPGFEGRFEVRDVNRDGLPDLDVTAYGVVAGVVSSQETVAINQGNSGAVVNLAHPGIGVTFGPAITTPSSLPGFAPTYPVRPQLADIDGDGFYDLFTYQSMYNNSTVTDPRANLAGVSFGQGSGSSFADARNSYLQVLHHLSPQVTTVSDLLKAQIDQRLPDNFNPIWQTDDEDFGATLADIDGDGLADLIRYHENAGPAVTAADPNCSPLCGGGMEILYNTGTTWLDPDGITAWQRQIGPSGTRAVSPSLPADVADIGSAFVDLNGDGLVDLIQEEQGDQDIAPGAWINTNQVPVISTFPNGLAAPTTPSYRNITSAEGETTYKDDDTTKDNTKLLTVPLLVVANLTAADGSGTGVLNRQTFTYHSLRQDTNGRGPLGFNRVEIQDQASNTVTVTRYAQVYPYTGLPAQVDKYQLSHDGSQQYLMTKTVTTYCDGTVPNVEFECGEDFGHGVPTGSLFVFPQSIIDTTYLHPEANDTTDTIVIDSEFQYNDSGNATQTSTTTTKKEHCAVDNDGTKPCATEQFSKTLVNTYATAAEQEQGKPDSTVVTAIGGTKNTSHTTSFEYATADTFGGNSSRLALTKTHVEPGAGWPIQLDTAYRYDRFGNLTTTTSCASDFDSCNATNPPTANPFGPSDPLHHPPFRTTSVSYDPSILGVPVGYGPGRFPVRSTDAAGHSQTTVYDPVLGALLTKTDPNAIETCYAYDALGRQTSQTERCGSGAPLSTTSDRRLAVSDPTVQCSTGAENCTAKVVTVVTPPSGNTVWTFTDDQGHVVETLTGGFDGSLIETRTLHDTMGRVWQQSKPFLSTDQPSFTVTQLDDFKRVWTVTDPLGLIDNSGQPKSTTITTTYNGSTIKTQRAVDRPGGPVAGEPVTETQFETKNALGKVESESRVTEIGTVTTSYAYDADGNVTITTDPVGNQIVIGYDGRGRKQTMSDPDMGNWTYKQDGFGDLVEQIDPNALQLDPSTTGTTMTHDPLGRMLTKTTSEGTAQWRYDVGAGAVIGQLVAMVGAPDPKFAGDCTIPSGFEGLSGGNRAVKVFGYDEFGQLQQVGECADGANFTTSYQYDSLGRQSQIRYPVINNSIQLAVGYHYTSLGFLQYLTDDSSDYSVLWQAKVVNALGQVTDEQMRNGVETVSSRNPLTGWLLGTTATAHADNEKRIQNWGYEFDELGDLLTRTRTDDVNQLTSQETFGYDLTNRLLTANVQMSNGSTSSNSYLYDAIGNLTQKDGKTYHYGTSAGCAAGPHAVCSVDGGTLYMYDANGNMTSTAGRTVTYNASNKVTKIVSEPMPSQGNDTGTIDLIYGADANRVVQLLTSGSKTVRTVYVGLGGTGKSLYEQTTTQTAGSTTVQNLHYIYAGGVHGGNAFAVRVIDDTANTTKYYSFDHLGSVTAVSDEQGRVSTSGSEATVLAYDVWGARRNSDESAAIWQSFEPPTGNREFTGQEQMPDVGLVNMNGRVYDPVLGRFLSPDPNVQNISDTQNYNRYTYALNNPLRYTDPTGFSFVGSLESTLESPVFWYEVAYSTAICLSAPGVGCVLAGVQLAMTNLLVSVASGVGADQAAINLGIGIGVGLAGLKMPEMGPLWRLAVGSASAAATTALANRLGTGKWGGGDILAAAFLSAAEGAAMMGIGAVTAKISQASAAQGGSGALSPETRQIREFLGSGGFQLTDPTDPGVTGGPFALGEPLSASPEGIPGCNAFPCEMPDVPPDWTPSISAHTRPFGSVSTSQYPAGWAMGITASGVPTPIVGPGWGLSFQLFSSGQLGLYTINPASSLAFGTPGLGVTLDYSQGPGTAASWAGPFRQQTGSIGWGQGGMFEAGTVGTGGWEGISLGVGLGPPVGVSVGTFNYKLIWSWP
jgi:RHS repeat-associated protein